VSRASTVSGERPAIDPADVAGLRTMMRATVTEGTGQLVAGQGEVYGKTGEAEYAGGSHAWFVGYRGDLAFATLIVGGGGSERAVLATRDVLSAIPTQP
ncbi:MAG: penicillin-binding transpeptidase domain-containing protein, partial [Mycobacteriaceae bacterium]|nr:penicillin-binding transpeptidase domain-containing protein [Mycobacteriaceae bacterium]